MVVAMLVGCASEPDTTAPDPRSLICVDEPARIEPCAVTGPVCSLDEIARASRSGVWTLDPTGSYDWIEFDEPEVAIHVELDARWADLPTGDLLDRARQVRASVGGVHVDAPVPFESWGSLPSDLVELEVFERDGDLLRIVLSSPSFEIQAEDQLEHAGGGCREGDVRGRCWCAWEVPAAVRIEVEAPVRE